MNFEDAIKAISELENSEEVVKAILEKERKKNKENESLRKRKNQAEEASRKMENLTKLLTENGVDLDGDAEEQITGLLKPKTSDSDLKKTQNELAALKKMFQETSKANEALKKKNMQKEIKERLYKDFSEKVLNPNVALDYRIKNGDFKMNENGDVVYLRDGLEVSDDIFQAFAEDHKEEIKAPNVGAGTRPGAGAKAMHSFSEEQLNSMSSEEFLALPETTQQQIEQSLMNEG